MQEFFLTIKTKPIGKGRPRFQVVRGKPHVYTPESTERFERIVSSYWHEQHGPFFKGPVSVAIWATFEPAKSLSKAKKAEALESFYTKKPDVDNIAKSVLDGLNLTAWEDDSQVVELKVNKKFGIENQIEIYVKELIE